MVLLSLSLVSVFAAALPRYGRLLYLVLLSLMVPVGILLLISYYFTGKFQDDSVFYHLFYGVAGAGFAEYRVPVILSLLIVLTYILVSVVLYRRPAAVRLHWRYYVLRPLPFILLLAALASNPAVISLQSFYKRQHQQLVMLQPKAITDEFRRYYRVDRLQALPGRQPANLLLIYAESLERSYFDEQRFPGLMPQLKALEPQAVSFTRIGQAASTNWTIAGIVASQCGLPLITPAAGGSMSGMDQFYPKAVCLSDLLTEQGYTLHFTGGAETAFAGKEKYLQTHSYQHIEGKEQLLAELDDAAYQSSWGLYDDSLLAIVFRRFEQLVAQKTPFALVTLTLGTHHPAGHLSADCRNMPYDDGLNPMLNAVHCSDRQLASLIRRVMNSDAGKNTVIVLASDHLAMRNTATSLLERGERHNLLMIFSPFHPQGQRVDEPGTTLDTASTVLPFLGFSGEVGLGRNLMQIDEQQRADRAVIQHKLDADDSWRDIIGGFWGFPGLEQGLQIDPQLQQLAIAERSMKIPALLVIDENLEAVPYFEFDNQWMQQSLADRFHSIDDHLLILVDTCRNAGKVASVPDNDGICLVVGKDRHIILSKKLAQTESLQAGQLRQWLQGDISQSVPSVSKR